MLLLKLPTIFQSRTGSVTTVIMCVMFYGGVLAGQSTTLVQTEIP